MLTVIVVLFGALSVAAVPQFKPSILSLADTPAPNLAADEEQGQGGDGDTPESESEDQQPEPPTDPTPTTPEVTENTEELEPNDSKLPIMTRKATSQITPTNTSHGAILSSSAANITITTQTPTSTPKSLIPHWSYKKSSIAAASIFSSIALAAFIFLLVMYIRRLKRARRQKKLERQKRIGSSYSSIPLTEDHNLAPLEPKPAAEGKSDRDSLMFSSGSRSPSVPFVFDEEKSLISRAFRMDTTGAPSAAILEQVGGLSRSSLDRANASLAPVNLATLDRQYDPLLLSSQRRESLAKPIVVVRPPLNPIVPLSASTSSAADEQVAPHNPHVVSSASQYQLRGDQRRSMDRDSGESSKSAKSNRLALLPSIQRSSSPIFMFSEV